MQMLTIENWKKRIDRQFEAGLFSEVVIGGKEPYRKTKEITNFEFCLTPEKFEFVDAPVPEEIIERDFILSKSKQMFKDYLSKDINSRQACFVNNYDLADNHCISYFQHYVRNDKCCMNIYVRSMDYKRNFVYDCQTFNLAYQEVFSKLKETCNIVEGFMRVFVFSLHVYE